MNSRNAYYSQDEDQPWQDEAEQATDPFEEPFEPEDVDAQRPTYQQDAFDDESYDDPQEHVARQPRFERKQRKPAVISTNATTNLTCTICAASGLFGLFLFFADRRSRVVRRFAAQSAGLFCLMTFLSIGLIVIAMLLGYIPFIGGVLSAIVWILWAGLLCWVLYQRVQLMSHAYRGEAYVMPVIGRYFRQFE